MKKNELIQLRELVEKERKRRIRINELLDSELVKEYLLNNNLEPVILDSDNIREIINNILKEFTITSTNNIYVCVRAYQIDCDINYQETTFYTRNVEIDSKKADYKLYNNLESDEIVKASKEKFEDYPLINEFEENNIILNPYNTNENMNGYKEVKLDFFENSINYSQSKSKQLLLKKYTRNNIVI